MHVILVSQPNSDNFEQELDYERSFQISMIEKVTKLTLIGLTFAPEVIITKDFRWIGVQRKKNIILNFFRLQLAIVKNIYTTKFCITFYQGPIRAFPSILFLLLDKCKRSVIECHGDIYRQSINYSGSRLKTIGLILAEKYWVNLALRLSWRIRVLGESSLTHYPYSFFSDKTRSYPPFIFISKRRELVEYRMTLCDKVLECKSPHFRRKVIIAGSLEPVKSFDLIYSYLLNIFKPQDFTIWDEIHIYGDGNLRNLASELSTLSYVIWHGHKSQDTLFNSMAASDCVFLLSQSEGYPRVICEALKLRVPVVVSNVGHVSEIVNGYRYAYITDPPSDPYSISKIFTYTYNSLYKSNNFIKASANTRSFTAKINFITGITSIVNEAAS